MLAWIPCSTTGNQLYERGYYLPFLYFLINKKSMEESLVFSSILKESLPRKQTVTKIVNGRLEIRLSLIGSPERTAFRSDFILKM